MDSKKGGESRFFFARKVSLRGAQTFVFPSASNLRRSLIKAREGELIRFQSPVGVKEIEILEVRYEVIG
jgi:hypothetical protein